MEYSRIEGQFRHQYSLTITINLSNSGIKEVFFFFFYQIFMLPIVENFQLNVLSLCKEMSYIREIII